MDVTYDVPDGVSCVGTIITFHGGAFTGGSTAWDVEQNKLLASQGFRVHQVWFPTTTISQFLIWARAYTHLPDQGVPTYCLGRSSGGYLAKRFFDMHKDKVRAAVYIAPVLDPAARARKVPKFRARTNRFFDIPPSTFAQWDERREMLLLATNDKNVPLECYSEQQRRSAIFLGPSSHVAMCTCTDQALAETIRSFLFSNSGTGRKRKHSS